GVVQIFDFGYHVDGTAYIVMECLEGESLAARLDRFGRLRLVDALRLARQLSSSLGAAHERDIVHRDLKPGNVFVIRDTEVPGGERTKILDFGICKLGDPECATTTQTGTMLGTPVYMSPEQCRGAGRVDYRSDIYSLGCVLFHMITGQPPFDCESVGDYIAAHLKEPAPAPTSIVPELPPAVDVLIAMCLAKDPDARFKSMAELQHAIEEVLASLGDAGASMPAMPKLLHSVPLADGFKSSYDVNLGNKLRTVDQTPAPPSHPWFVDSLLPVSISNHYVIENPGLGWGKRLVLVLALFVGVAAGLTGTNHALESEAAAQTAAPDAPVITTLESAEPAYTQTAREVVPPEPEPEDIVAVEDEPVVAPPPPPAPTKKIRAARAQRPHVQKPARPRPVVRKATQSEPEDLYDTR
ncbi:MAG TPA: serine/threonine-protein kinase, partial [Kofleriaceae bacterium]